jgi:hypothetical protein
VELLRDTKKKVEVVINADGLVMYYNDDGYLNKSEGIKLLEALDNKELERYKLKPNVGIGPMTLFFTLDQMSAAIKYKPRSPASSTSSSSSPFFGSIGSYEDSSSDDDDDRADLTNSA